MTFRVLQPKGLMPGITSAGQGPFVVPPGFGLDGKEFGRPGFELFTPEANVQGQPEDPYDNSLMERASAWLKRAAQQSAEELYAPKQVTTANRQRSALIQALMTRADDGSGGQ